MISSETLVMVVILNWNGLEDTLACLSSVFVTQNANFRVIVIDNNSAKDELSIIKQQFPEIIPIQSQVNLGFTGGCNLGIEYALQHDAEYIWLLNNDAIIFPNTLMNLVYEIEKHLEIGMVSPVVKSENYTYWGTYLDITTQTRRNFTSIEDLNSAKETSPRNICLWGTALLIKTEAIKRVGLLDDAFFAYFEDMDFSLRIRSAGYRNVICTAALIRHGKNNQSQINRPDHYYFYMARNEYLFWIKHLPVHQKATFMRKYISRTIRKSAGYLDAKAISASDACLDGLWSALTNQSGERTSDQVMPVHLKKLISSHLYFWSRLLSKR